jgi:hypothetical protein
MHTFLGSPKPTGEAVVINMQQLLLLFYQKSWVAINIYIGKLKLPIEVTIERDM